MASAGIVSVKVQPDLSAFQVDLQKQLEEMESPVRTLLTNFSEWLDSEGIIPGASEHDDPRTHAELVTEFLDYRRARFAEAKEDDNE